MLTPLVIAMPEPMAEALGYPDQPVGWADILELASEPGGLGRLRPSRVGPVPARQDQPELLDQRADGAHRPELRRHRQDRRASRRGPRRPEVIEFATGVESAVVHYGDTTLTFLNNWYRADQRGTALTYASAVAVEEKSVIDYNAGNPDGVLDAGRGAPPAAHPAGGDLPRGGHALLRQPVLRARRRRGSTTSEKEAAARVRGLRQQPENQRKVLEFGFRPGNPDVADRRADRRRQRRRPRPAADPARGARPRRDDRAARPLGRPAQERPGAARHRRVRLDGRPGRPGDRRDQARPGQGGGHRARSTSSRTRTRSACASSPPTSAGDPSDDLHRPRADRARSAEQPRAAARRDRRPRPRQRHAAVRRRPASATTTLSTSFDPTRINAVVLLTDGVNDDGDADDDDEPARRAARPTSGRQRGRDQPSRCGSSRSPTARTPTWPCCAASPRRRNAAVYNASDPTTINQVLTAVVSNF